MKVLEMLEAGKITAEDASKLLSVLNDAPQPARQAHHVHLRNHDVEEKLQTFAKDVNHFAKEVGHKMQDWYKTAEPKIKRTSQAALEKAAVTLDNLAQGISNSLEKMELEKQAPCCADNTCATTGTCENPEDTPQPN